MPPIAYHDENYSYFKHTTQQGKEHLSKKRRKNCSYCSSAAVFVGIFKYSRHKKAEPLCNEHSIKFSDGELPSPVIPDLEIK